MGKIFWCSHASSKAYIARPKPFPSISTKAEEICISDRILRACMFTCKNPIKRYPIPYAKTIYFGVEHASEYPFKEVKVRNLWIFSFFSSLFIRPLWVFAFSLRFFFDENLFLVPLHSLCSSDAQRNTNHRKFRAQCQRNEFSNSCTISVQELPVAVANHFINDFDLSNESRRRRTAHHLLVRCAARCCRDWYWCDSRKKKSAFLTTSELFLNNSCVN